MLGGLPVHQCCCPCLPRMPPEQSELPYHSPHVPMRVLMSLSCAGGTTATGSFPSEGTTFTANPSTSPHRITVAVTDSSVTCTGEYTVGCTCLRVKQATVGM